MDRNDAVQYIHRHKLIAVIRADSSDGLQEAFHALAEGGVRIIEYTMTTPGAVEAIAQCSANLPDSILLGAGTVLNKNDAKAVIDAGAQFVVSPGLDEAAVEYTLSQGKIAIPGCLTPTEVTRALSIGADFIKVFPVGQVGGAKYIKALKAPFPQANLLAVGGVDKDNIAEYINAGACGIGIGAKMVKKSLLQAGDYATLTAHAKQFVEALP